MMTAGALAARLSLDAAGFKAEMADSGTVADRELKRIGRQVQFVNDYIREMAKAQKTANDAGAGIAASAKHMEEFGFHTAGAKRELLVLAHELSQGNFSRFGGSLLVLGERTGAAGLLFSGMGAAVVAAVAALGSFVAAAAIGAHESDQLTKSLILTNDAAGLTSSTFAQLAQKSAEATGSTIGQSKTALQDLVSTGRFSQQVIGEANDATLLLAKVSGQSTEEIVKDFAKMSDGVAKWAQEHNRQYHYLTVAQFAYIKQLEDQGRLEDAEKENFRLLNDQMSRTTQNLGYLESAWKGVKDWASQAWDAMKGVGRAATTDEQLQDARKRLEAMQARGPLNSLTTGSFEKGVERLKQEIYLLQEKSRLERQAADLQSTNAAKDQKAIDDLMKRKPEKVEPLSAIRDPQQQYRHDFLVSEIASYDDLAEAERKAAQEAAKLAKEQDKSFNDWFQKFDEKERAHNMDPSDARNTAIGKYLRDIGDQTKRAEELVNGSFARMEDAIVEFVKTGKLSFSDLFNFMAEDYIRNLIRMTEKSLFTDAAGNFLGFGNLFSGAASAVGNFFGFGHANGLDYVPYDGYPAILHKGERVQTAVQARSGGSNGAPTIDASIGRIDIKGDAVSRGEMNAAIRQALAAQSKQTMRMLQQGKFA